MRLRPQEEYNAPQQVLNDYTKISQMLGVPHVPMMFQYVGVFPEYCSYLTQQMERALQDKKITAIIDDQATIVQEIMTTIFPLPDGLKKASVQMHTEIERLVSANAKLSFLFICLRETVKSWGSVHGSLPGTTKKEEETALQIIPKSLLYERNNYDDFFTKAATTFEELQKDERLLFFRVKLEKMILSAIDMVGNPLFSPINVVLQLTNKYENFSDLVYLLADEFPSHAVKRLLFSGWLMV